MSKQLIEVIRLLTDENERLKARVESLEKVGLRLSEMNGNQAKTIHQLNKACFRMKRRLRAGRLPTMKVTAPAVGSGSAP